MDAAPRPDARRDREPQHRRDRKANDDARRAPQRLNRWEYQGMTITSTPPTWEAVPLLREVTREAWMTGTPSKSARSTGAELGLAAPKTTPS